MRDMQGCYSRYLNKKYKDAPELLVGPLDLPAAILSKYFRAGPVNWTPRFDALHLDERGFRKFLRYIENNPGAGWFGAAGLAVEMVERGSTLLG